MYIPSYTIMPPFVLRLQVCHIHSLYEMYSQFLYHTFYKGVTCRFANIVLDILSSYRLFLGTTYQSLCASFQITFSHSPRCVVLVLVLHVSCKLTMYFFCSPFIFSLFFSFLEFFKVNFFLVCYSSTFSVYSSKSILSS